MRWILGLLLTAALVGCAQKSAPISWAESSDEVVFQIHSSGGFIPPFDAQLIVPELTVFGDGRVLILQTDLDGPARIAEAKLSKEQLETLLRRADQAMVGLKAQYAAIEATDLGITTFRLSTDRGRRATGVYGFMWGPSELEQERATMQRLRDLRAAFLGALPKQLAAHIPDEVSLIALPIDPKDYSFPLPTPQDWPEGLVPVPQPDATGYGSFGTITLKGEEARKLAGLVPYKARWPYRYQEKLYFVGVKPAIPVSTTP